MGESAKFLESRTFETQILKLAVCPLNIHDFKSKINGHMSLDNQKSYYGVPSSAF